MNRLPISIRFQNVRLYWYGIDVTLLPLYSIVVVKKNIPLPERFFLQPLMPNPLFRNIYMATGIILRCILFSAVDTR